MSRRKQDLFDNLSFLDIVFGALGAVLFLFIVVDKGSATEASIPADEMIKVYMDMDTTGGYRFHGRLPDSIQSQLATLPTGTPIKLVINGRRALPGQVCPPCPVVRCPDGAKPCPPEKKCPECPKCPEQKTETGILCGDPACPKVVSNSYSGDPLEIPYSIGFAIVDNTSYTNDIDIKVCRAGTCVPEGRSNTGGGMRWVDLREKGSFFQGGKKARTGGEMVLVEDAIAPGEYTVSAKFDPPTRSRTPQAPTRITATVATKQGGRIREQRFDVSLEANSQWKPVCRVSIDANGNITQLAL